MVAARSTNTWAKALALTCSTVYPPLQPRSNALLNAVINQLTNERTIRQAGKQAPRHNKMRLQKHPPK